MAFDRLFDDFSGRRWGADEGLFAQTAGKAGVAR